MTSLTGTRSVTWMDPPEAAAHAGVDIAQIARAGRERELPAVTTHPRRPGVWMMRSSDIDAWALWTLGRPTAGTTVSGTPAFMACEDGASGALNA